jgi:1-acyl-sn-glycerol-3-phosphate acyltransferase
VAAVARGDCTRGASVRSHVHHPGDRRTTANPAASKDGNARAGAGILGRSVGGARRPGMLRSRAMPAGGEDRAPGVTLPRRGNRGGRAIARALLRLWRWRLEGEFPAVPKAVVVVAPHTTNWDFPVGVLTLFALDLRIHWLGKHTLFRWPLRPLMLWLDGIPVVRGSGSGTVARLVEMMTSSQTMLLAVAPEGTRSDVAEWRMGFAHIAIGARVPVIPVTFDWPRRTVRVGAAMPLSGDLAADETMLRAWFAAPPPPAG